MGYDVYFEVEGKITPSDRQKKYIEIVEKFVELGMEEYIHKEILDGLGIKDISQINITEEQREGWFVPLDLFTKRTEDVVDSKEYFEVNLKEIPEAIQTLRFVVTHSY